MPDQRQVALNGRNTRKMYHGGSRPLAALQAALHGQQMMFALRSHRGVLLLVLLAAIVTDGVWLAHSLQRERAAFFLEPTQTVFSEERTAPTVLPEFDPRKSRWLFEGKPLSSLQNFMIDADPEHLGPDSVGKFVAVRLPDHADADILRRALVSLAADGQCQVAVLGFDDLKASDRFTDATVYRIKEVLNDAEKSRSCPSPLK